MAELLFNRANIPWMSMLTGKQYIISNLLLNRIFWIIYHFLGYFKYELFVKILSSKLCLVSQLLILNRITLSAMLKVICIMRNGWWNNLNVPWDHSICIYKDGRRICIQFVAVDNSWETTLWLPSLHQMKYIYTPWSINVIDSILFFPKLCFKIFYIQMSVRAG